MKDNIHWGIDLGGTKVEGVVFEKHGNEIDILCRTRVPTEQEHGYEHIISQIDKLVNILKKETGLQPSKIGIGTPGATEPSTGLLKNSNTQCLLGKPLFADLRDKLQVELRMANDANCFALAEAQLGAVTELDKPVDVVFGIIMGTGVGGGLVVGDKVINGRHGIGGEWGHNVLEPDGHPCYCGKAGCTETVISGPSLERYYKEQTGHVKALRDIVKDRTIDIAAEKTMQRLFRYFGEGVARLINVIDPGAIVLGGGVSNVDALYDEGVAQVVPYLFNNELHTPFLRPKLGDSAGVIGAALL